MRSNLVRAVLSCLIVLLLTGCGRSFPDDSRGTLEQATNGVLRVGISENPPWTDVADDGTVTGSEVELVQAYAESINARIEWVPGSESVLADQTKHDQLDVVIGGLTKDSPWTDKIALTRPYQSVPAADGSTDKMVMGVQLGENALLISLETFLAEQQGEL